ncbi:MAG TPA: NrfD/PsrC family molybdoenzyme membrane anchor subunit [Thermoanaerobaculia bacterium]
MTTEFESIPHSALPIWGWQIAVYLFLGGMAAGVMILSGILRGQSRAARRLIFLAPIALSIGMLALFLDLEHKLHVFRFYTAFRITSPMSWGSWILLLIYPATLLYGVRPTERLRKINIALGIALGAYTGILLGTLTARAAWSSLFLAPLFLVSGVSAAAAVAMLLPLSESERASIRRWDLIAIGAEALVLAFFFLDLKGGAASLFFGGAYTAPFWSLVVIAGLLVPAALELVEAQRRVHVAIAPALVLVGGLALRWIFVLAGQA